MTPIFKLLKKHCVFVFYNGLLNSGYNVVPAQVGGCAV